MDPMPQLTPENKPSRRWPFSRKVTIIGSVVIVVLLFIAYLIIDDIIASQSNKQTALPKGIQYDRPGYDRNSLGTSVADPFAVKFTPESTPEKYQGKSILQACNLLSTKNIQDEGFVIRAQPLTIPIARTYYDGVGKAAFDQDTSSSFITGSSLGSDVNNCTYVLEGANDQVGSITVNAFQPFTVPEATLLKEVGENYDATQNVNGLETFKKRPSDRDTDERSEFIVLKRGEGAFYASLKLGSKQSSKEQAVLGVIAKNFTEQMKKLTGMSKLTYDTPTFKKSYARACDLFTNQDMRTLGNRDAGPLVRENIASSTGSITYTNTEDRTPYVYIDNECIRTTVGGGSGLGGMGSGDYQLTVLTTSFESDVAAKHALDFEKRMSKGDDVNVGDEGTAYQNVSGQNIEFRKGRIIVRVSLNDISIRTLRISGSQATQKLLPIAKSMADRVKE
jgi:hypothetical protein